MDHDWVINLFQKFGKVNYVSLPKYKKSGKIKGFGFVEFADPEALEKAVQTYQEFNGVLTYSVLEAEKLMSIATFQKENEEQEVPAESVDPPKPVEDEKELEEPPKKRLRTSSKSEDEKKESEETPVIPESQKEDEESDGTSEGEATTENEEANKEETPAQPKKKRRKHKKKHNPRINQGFQDEKIYEIKIMKKFVLDPYITSSFL